ncbi:hypothetical protein CYY_006366 [Polysphondylium violaceum]|uniref:Phox domain-containing protein n=1 Tax=Polysphondylium violaceum TaxID=133409 RepID=A0A8J4Q055_9MYCE|nr:hypothetical protein CYY_006366 [Polysphondylium violaceum]
MEDDEFFTVKEGVLLLEEQTYNSSTKDGKKVFTEKRVCLVSEAGCIILYYSDIKNKSFETANFLSVVGCSLSHTDNSMSFELNVSSNQTVKFHCLNVNDRDQWVKALSKYTTSLPVKSRGISLPELKNNTNVSGSPNNVHHRNFNQSAPSLVSTAAVVAAADSPSCYLTASNNTTNHNHSDINSLASSSLTQSKRDWPDSDFIVELFPNVEVSVIVDALEFCGGDTDEVISLLSTQTRLSYQGDLNSFSPKGIRKRQQQLQQQQQQNQHAQQLTQQQQDQLLHNLQDGNELLHATLQSINNHQMNSYSSSSSTASLTALSPSLIWQPQSIRDNFLNDARNSLTSSGNQLNSSSPIYNQNDDCDSFDEESSNEDNSDEIKDNIDVVAFESKLVIGKKVQNCNDSNNSNSESCNIQKQNNNNNNNNNSTPTKWGIKPQSLKSSFDKNQTNTTQDNNNNNNNNHQTNSLTSSQEKKLISSWKPSCKSGLVWDLAVKINGFFKLGDHIEYRIHVITSYSEWFVFRRYNNFLMLDKKLKSLGVIDKKDPLLSLPPKKLRGSSNEVAKERQEGLQQYLSSLLYNYQGIFYSNNFVNVFLNSEVHSQLFQQFISQKDTQISISNSPSSPNLHSSQRSNSPTTSSPPTSLSSSFSPSLR